NVEEGLAGRNRLVGVAEAGTNGQALLHFVLGTQFVDVDVFPAETGAVVGTQRRRQVQVVGNGTNAAVFNVLPIGRHGQCRVHLPGHTGAVVLRNVEAAVLGEQTFITVEFVGFDFGRPGRTQRYAFGHFTLPAQFYTPAVTGVGAIITHGSTIL